VTVFWILAPLMVLAAVGLVFARKAVHAALCLAVVMLSLAVLYAIQGAPFLFAVQVIVYTGAIMMLFLFVLMLVGVETVDSMRETIRGHRIVSFVAVLLFGVLAIQAVAQTVTTKVVGFGDIDNVGGLAALMFGPYVLAFELTSALLITAALAAMVLAHRERLSEKPTQAALSRRRMREYAETGRHPGNPPTPGVFARHNAVDTPALLPDGTPLEGSIASSLIARGQRQDRSGDAVEEMRKQLTEFDTTPQSGATRPPGEPDGRTEPGEGE
jgi:NADH-quinone oxidoreductase subunit J